MIRIGVVEAFRDFPKDSEVDVSHYIKLSLTTDLQENQIPNQRFHVGYFAESSQQPC